MVDYLRIADRSWPVLGPLMRAHAFVYRVSGGRIGRRLPGLPPMLVLTHFGARSGKRRSTPLVYMPEGDSYVIVAAKGGHPEDPAWMHNLRANPGAEVQVGPRRIKVRAVEADAEERRRLWPLALAHNPLWGRYQRRTAREVPLIVLRPLRN
jgi:deazaflavin-dependent oxidoreductase (nitroreductase family)